MRFIVAAALSFLVLLSGCVATVGRHIEVPYPFDAAEARRLTGPGPGLIKGSALIRQQGGGIVTCAGQPVQLIPVTRYSNRRIAELYGNATVGFKRPEKVTFDPDPPEYLQLARGTTCDPQGHFEFTRVAEGEFFLIAPVLWQVGYVQQGGFMMRRVEVKAGQEPITLVLTPNMK